MTTHKHEILSLDVWGNKKDGWEVNGTYHTGIFVDLTNDMTDAEIIKAIRQAVGHRADARGYEMADLADSVQFCGVCITRASTGKPAYQTRAVRL